MDQGRGVEAKIDGDPLHWHINCSVSNANERVQGSVQLSGAADGHSK